MKNIKKLPAVVLAASGIFFVGCTKSIETAKPQNEIGSLRSDNATVWTANIQLSGAEEVPAVTTSTTGVAILRLTAGGTLHTRINVENMEMGDALLFAHIHFGAKGTNGGVFLGIADMASDFFMNKKFMLSPAQVSTLQNNPLYVNVHSTKYPSGVIRGQIR